MIKNYLTDKIVPIIVFSIFGFIAATILLIPYIFEADNVKSGSLMYYIGTPGFIRSVKTIEKCRESTFRWKGRDGASKPYTSISYGSTHPDEELLRLYTVEFENKSCKVENEVNPTIGVSRIIMICENEEFTSVDITIEKTDGCKNVNIHFFENY